MKKSKEYNNYFLENKSFCRLNYFHLLSTVIPPNYYIPACNCKCCLQIFQLLCKQSLYNHSWRKAKWRTFTLSLLMTYSVWISRSEHTKFFMSYNAVIADVSYLSSPQVLSCYLNLNIDFWFTRLKPVEQLSPMLNPSDCETKFERKKALPSHVGTQSDPTISTKLCSKFLQFLN